MKSMKLLLATLVMSTIMATAAWGGEWKQDGNGWWYQNDDSSYAKSGWQTIDGKSYYFGDDGYVFHDCVTPDGYTVGSDGVWIQTQVTPLFDFSADTCSAKYTNHQVKTADYDGYPCLIIYYDYTNKDSKAKSACFADCYITAFQNGIQCDNTWLSSTDDDKALSNYYKEVMPGTTINVAQVYRIIDMSDVTVQIRKMLNWGDNANTVSATLKLN